MLKKFTVLGAALLLALTGLANAQTWQFSKLFPSNTFQTTNGSGINNGMAVDPMGRLWISSYTTTKDSILQGDGTYLAVGQVWVFNPDGSQASFSPMKVLNGVDQNGNAVHDTLNGYCLGRGTAANGYSGTSSMRTGADGNIYLARGSGIIWKINYQDGTVMQRIIDPIPGFAPADGTGSLDCAVSSDGELYVAPVFPGASVVALSADFNNVDQVIDASSGYGRSILVSSDGKDIYVPRYSMQATLHYQGDALSGYTFKDTLFAGLSGNCTAWDPKTGYLWISAGGTDGAVSAAPWLGSRVYGFDMSDPSKPALKDSILWNLEATGVTTPGKLAIRGMAFTSTGDTVYMGLFSHDTAAVQMFVNTATPVIEKPQGVATQYSLSQNYPNPFNPSTKIDFAMKATGQVALKVYDILGREVASLINGVQSAGQHSVMFNANNLPSGVYMYTLTTSDGMKITKKMILMK